MAHPVKAHPPDAPRGVRSAGRFHVGMRRPLRRVGLLLAILVTAGGPVRAEESATAWPLDERPGEPGEWGFRPLEGEQLEVSPPNFVWRPQKDAASYELQVDRDATFPSPVWQVRDLEGHYHTPPEVLASGRWSWRFRAVNADGQASAWSRVRSFEIEADATPYPMPRRDELLGRVPREHPRLFVRPEQLPELRRLAGGELSEGLAALVRRCDRILDDPPPTGEPPKYPPDVEFKSEQWREIWWGNRRYTIEVLDSAATLAFTRLLTGNDDYGDLARRLLLDAAGWDSKGATGYRYNDEAGMPYAYHFSRTYTFLHDMLSEEERALCREVMRVRGQEMYDHLAPRHIWRPYGSHSNRAWHFLGEVGVAFLDEIPEAGDWLWFAMNVFFNAYPVWNDDDGGWHEGMQYWASYISRFTWWADAMRVAMDIDAFCKPYFSRIGYYPMYLQPPGTVGGGFGDLAGRRRSSHNIPLMRILTAQSGNTHWQWYVEAHEAPSPDRSYIGFLRGSLPEVEPKPPADLPTARCFRGTGQAVMNTTLLDGKDNVQFMFKSSPFGTQSHGYDANNAFLLSAFGERLFISSGWRDIYGSDHHVNWMWHTKSTNSITVNGGTQIKRSPLARGEILDFHTSEGFDFVAGEAGGAYADDVLDRFTRRVVFVKPELIVIHDRLVAKEPSTFEWWLHAPNEMVISPGQRVMAASGDARCEVTFLTPEPLDITQTDQFDPPPRPRVRLVEYHLTAATPSPQREAEFVTVLRPHRTGRPPRGEPRLVAVSGGWGLEVPLAQGRAIVLLRAEDARSVAYGPVRTDAAVAAVHVDEEGNIADEKLLIDGTSIERRSPFE